MEGLDAHWKSKHEHVMSYDELWSSLCLSHRRNTRSVEKLEKPFQRIGTHSNSHVGRDFEIETQKFFHKQGLELSLKVKVPVGIEGKTKHHAFDLGCEHQKVIVECKSHRWTSGDNVPSAKMTVWNEAMFYFVAAPREYRKIMFVLRDFSVKKKETLAEYYLRTYQHLVPDGVEFWEYDESTEKANRLR